MASPEHPAQTPPPPAGPTRDAPILRALDEQFHEVRWGAPPEEVQTLYPGGRLDSDGGYTVLFPLVGYPYPVLLTFAFAQGLAGITVLYPRSYDMATGDMDLPGRMVAESIYRHLSALLIIAHGGAPDPAREPGDEAGEEVLAVHSWTTRASTVRLEFHLQSGMGRLRVTLAALPPAPVPGA